jgi:DNA-binding NtrC family response regulator
MPYQILIVDDQAEILLGLKNILETNKAYSCLLSNRLDLAEKVIMQIPIDVVILDVYISDDEPNGFEFAKKIRNMGFAGKIAMITGYIPNKIPDQYYGCFDVFFRKPFSTGELQQWLKSVLENADED